MAKTHISNWESFGLENFLVSMPGMRLEEISDAKLVIEGEYQFTSTHDDSEPGITDSYEIRIEFPGGYPREVPSVYEVGERIPSTLSNHIYADNSFCLGSPIRLKRLLQKFSDIGEFCEKIIMPFLYSYSYKEKNGSYPFGELAHYGKGLFKDYEDIFDVRGRRAVLLVLKALASSTIDAHRQSCPCGCKRALGKCDFKYKINEWRSLDSRKWYKRHLKYLTREKY